MPGRPVSALRKDCFNESIIFPPAYTHSSTPHPFLEHFKSSLMRSAYLIKYSITKRDQPNIVGVVAMPILLLQDLCKYLLLTQNKSHRGSDSHDTLHGSDHYTTQFILLFAFIIFLD